MNPPADERKRRAGVEPLSSWLLSLYAVTVFFGGFYLARYSGGFSGASLDPGIAPQSISADVAMAGRDQIVSAVADAPAAIQVTIRNMKFDPPTLEVKKGDIVEWKNDDITPHTATSPTFDSGSIDPDKFWRHTFTETGNFPYSCTFHPDMKAVVSVR